MKKFILLLLLCTPLYADIPALSGRIVDNANIIDAKTEAELTDRMEDLENSTGIQLGVLTVASLGNYATIEEFAQEVFDKWKLGQAKKDNGLLLCVSFAEKKIRLQTGYGLEGTLTDTKCGIIIDSFILPDFKEGNYSEGIKKGIESITGYLNGDETITKKLDARKSSKAPLIPFVIWFIFIAIVIVSNIPARKNGHIYPGTGSGGPFDGHHRRGGGFGGGFGGGGGFSGGGGRSGGGGASRGW